MDTKEATELLSWLEEERRRDKALLAELRKEVDQHKDQLSGAIDRMGKFEESLAQTTAESAKMSRFQQALQQFKDEILLELQRWQERFRKEGEQRDELLRQERQDRVQALAQLEEGLKEALQLRGPLQTQQAEMQRLNKVTSAQKLQLDEALKEGREQQERLLAFRERVNRSEERLAELLQEGEAQKARSEKIEDKLKFLEGWAEERGPQQMADLQTFGERLREEQAQLVGELRTIDDRRKKQRAGWAKEMRTWRDEAERVREQLALSEKQYRSAERMLTALDQLKIQLEKDRDALQHMERTAEERQRQQLEDWRKENEMLWLRNEERWQQLSEENAKRDDRIASLWESHVALLRRQAGEVEKWIKKVEKHLTGPSR
ncbi:MAG: hypothetical protein CEE40_01280 [Chloroflexi bacterium B3_Chlor]|nr:MAG: hypothetical protein CEE40_01280 [Chloroflexi bacterium B3_Chlor]